MCNRGYDSCVLTGRRRGSENSLGYNVRMKRPKGLLLTAWIMVGMVVAGWLRMYYWPHHAQPAHPHAHLRVFIGVALLVVNIVEFVCISYYIKGRNWARIAILVVSVLSILELLRLNREDTLGQIITAAWALLGVFFLYWLNTRSVREFFKRGAAAIGPS